MGMKINIYYGGRGVIEDPTQYVIQKLTEVLEELRVSVNRYNLYEQRNGIAMLSNSLKDADAVILAASVEWYGIGGLMQQFLDACWMYADKKKLKKMYMFPVVVSTTFGEREAEYTLVRAWEVLGGLAMPGICAYVENHLEFEKDEKYAALIEKKGEDIYRTVNQKVLAYPSSVQASGQQSAGVQGIDLTPQESEQLSEYVSDETFVKKQKADVLQLSQKYKNILDQGKDESKQEFVKDIKNCFVAPEDDIKARYLIKMTDSGRSLAIEVAEGKLKVGYGEIENPDVTASTTRDVVNKLVHGRVTFQGAFMSGQLTYKGDFKVLRTFDTLFKFGE